MSYGYRRVTAQLRRQKWQVNRKRVQRLMQEMGLSAKTKRKGRKTTNSEHHFMAEVGEAWQNGHAERLIRTIKKKKLTCRTTWTILMPTANWAASSMRSTCTSVSISSIMPVLSILFISTFTRSTLGFEDALIAMPLLAMVVGMQVATPLVASAASTIAITILLGGWRSVDIKTAWRLIVSSLMGIPVGLFFEQGF